MTLRSEKIFRHVLGTSASEDIEVYHEKEDTFGTYVQKRSQTNTLLLDPTVPFLQKLSF